MNTFGSVINGWCRSSEQREKFRQGLELAWEDFCVIERGVTEYYDIESTESGDNRIEGPAMFIMHLLHRATENAYQTYSQLDSNDTTLIALFICGIITAREAGPDAEVLIKQLGYGDFAELINDDKLNQWAINQVGDYLNDSTFKVVSDLITIKQAMIDFKPSRSTILRKIKDGSLRSWKFGDKKTALKYVSRSECKRCFKK